MKSFRGGAWWEGGGGFAFPPVKARRGVLGAAAPGRVEGLRGQAKEQPSPPGVPHPRSHPTPNRASAALPKSRHGPVVLGSATPRKCQAEEEQDPPAASRAGSSTLIPAAPKGAQKTRKPHQKPHQPAAEAVWGEKRWDTGQSAGEAQSVLHTVSKVRSRASDSPRLHPQLQSNAQPSRQ